MKNEVKKDILEMSKPRVADLKAEIVKLRVDNDRLMDKVDLAKKELCLSEQRIIGLTDGRHHDATTIDILRRDLGELRSRYKSLKIYASFVCAALIALGIVIISMRSHFV